MFKRIQEKPTDIYHFNPTCEFAVGNGTVSWQPNQLLQKMEYDLVLLPIYYSQPSDYIIIDKEPSEGFLTRLSKLGIHKPNILLRKDINNPTWSNYKTDRLLPWGWSPAEHRFLTPLKEYCSEEFKKSPVFNWKPEHREIYSKKFALQILQKLLDEIDSPRMISFDQIARICISKAEIEELLKKYGNLMIKAPWSSSGRGLQPITKVPVHHKVWEKILGIINDQDYVIVEPLLNKAYDLAFQFEMKQGKVRYLGLSHFTADKKGQYRGNYLNGLPEGLLSEVRDFVLTAPEMILPLLIRVLEESDLAKYYEGNFGVDTLIFWDKNEKLKINPCLEINLRQNMGLLSLHLEHLIQPGIKGMYRTYYDPRKSFFEFTREMEIQFPLYISNQKITKGFFPLTDFDENSLFGAYILVE